MGQEIAPTCTDGPVTYMHMNYWHQLGDMSLFTREELSDPEFMKNYYRDPYGAYLDETAVHFGNRNIPGARTYWFNDTAAKLVCRTLTNFVGNKGRVSRFSWKMFPFYRELQGEHLGAEMFERVSFMRGRYADRHGSEGDTCIGRAVIIGKHINERGDTAARWPAGARRWTATSSSPVLRRSCCPPVADQAANETKKERNAQRSALLAGGGTVRTAFRIRARRIPAPPERRLAACGISRG